MNNELELFNEDAQEQLGYMENALIKVQEEGANDEEIGALFRAMHTIKGTAGMFGFDNIVSFTHVAENVLSAVREGKIQLGDDLIDLLLLVKDHVTNIIDLAVNETGMNDDVKKNNETLLSKLSKCLSGESPEPSREEAKKEEKKEIIEDEPLFLEEEKEAVEDEPLFLEEEEEERPKEKIWHISIKLKSDFFDSGMDAISLFKFLDAMGKIEKIAPRLNELPLLEDLNPKKAYIGFEIELLSSVRREEIVEVFEFVLDDIELSVFEKDDKKEAREFLKKEENPKELIYFLITNSFFAKDEIEEIIKKPQVEKIEQKKPIKEEKKPIAKEVSAPKIETKTVEVEKTNEDNQAKKTEKPSQKSFSLRVDSSKIDIIMNQISEMVIANAKIAQLANQADNSELSESTIVMSDMLEELRSGVMNIRMVQVGESFSKFKRIVSDATKKLGKDIDFTIEGEETELDKMVVEKISDPLMHMLRNSVDHGIEMPNERTEKGKNPKGKVVLRTYHDAGMIVIEIKDDGKGLNKEAILKKAIANKIIKENQILSDKEIFNLIFEAGLSTAEKVTDISGRGVGMDVVKRNIEDLRGTIDIASQTNKGSTITVRLPLTLAIIDGFLVQTGNTKYIIPLEMIAECIELDDRYKKTMKGNDFINLRDSILPLIDIRTYFKEQKRQTQRENVVVVRYGGYKMGLQVDELYGEFQTVVKPLSDIFKNVVGVNGGTILGSGEIALIFDIPRLIEYKISQSKSNKDE